MVRTVLLGAIPAGVLADGPPRAISAPVLERVWQSRPAALDSIVAVLGQSALSRSQAPLGASDAAIQGLCFLGQDSRSCRHVNRVRQRVATGRGSAGTGGPCSLLWRNEWW